jgi:tetratricopeptide (TPR) repeat protein
MKKALLLFMFGVSSLVFSQTTDYKTETRNLFNEGNWSQLIIKGEEAVLENKSSYQIEYRLGVAYYNLRKYFDSSKQFENIKKKYNISNDYTQEYLYYSYLFSGRSQDALLVFKSFPFHLQQKINVKSVEIIDYISVEGGIKLSSRRDIDIKNLSYYNIGLGQKIGAHLKINHAFSILSQVYNDFDYTQKEYYVNANIQVSKGFTIIPAYHYLNVSENNPDTEVSTFEDIYVNIFHLGLKKQWSRFTLMPNITYFSQKKTEENITTIQYGLDVGYTLNAFKDKIWLGFGFNILNKDSENHFIGNAKIHYQINRKSYLFLKYTNANTSNFSDDNAMFYTNAVSILNNKISTTFGYDITPKIACFVNYQFENSEDVQNSISFTYNTFITGIKYNI